VTLTINNRATGQVERFSYQDAVVHGAIVYLGRGTDVNRQFWPATNVDIEATESDWVIVIMPDGSQQKGRTYHGYSPGRG
jgi:hypothetical protein